MIRFGYTNRKNKADKTCFYGRLNAIKSYRAESARVRPEREGERIVIMNHKSHNLYGFVCYPCAFSVQGFFIFQAGQW
jgi:hypothetical protein